MLRQAPQGVLDRLRRLVLPGRAREGQVDQGDALGVQRVDGVRDRQVLDVPALLVDRTLVATVLPIPDDAGRALLVRHHRHLASGLTPAAFSYVCYGAG
ncbi:hypothetical protein [Amycolatopsis sp. NPDC003731]